MNKREVALVVDLDDVVLLSHVVNVAGVTQAMGGFNTTRLQKLKDRLKEAQLELLKQMNKEIGHVR